MSILPIAESKNSGLILVPTKCRPFCVISKIGHNSPAKAQKSFTSVIEGGSYLHIAFPKFNAIYNTDIHNTKSIIYNTQYIYYQI